ncbi:MAG: hypothetical protein H6622_11340 [Halobacteriovoraceae bacterium]|nr:hypothetical protein [Halobacteriovoraceae bacterium]
MLNFSKFLLFLLLINPGQTFAKDGQCYTERLYKNLYAKRFELNKSKGGFVLKLKLKNDSYYLLTNDKNFSLHCHAHYLNTHELNIASVTGAAIYPFMELNSVKLLKFISQPEFIYSHRKLKLTQVLSYPLRTESLLQKKINFLFFDWGNFSLSKLDKLNIASFPLSNFLESHPLGRAEWIVAFGIVLGKFEQSKKLFSMLESNYQLLSKKNKSTDGTVIVADYFRGKWVIPSENSDTIVLLKDAGLKPLITNTSQSPKILRTEVILKELSKTDLLLASGKKENLKIIKNKHPSMNSLKIFSYSARVNEYGAYDYWESGVFRPDLILRDLINIKQKQHKSLYYYEEI